MLVCFLLNRLVFAFLLVFLSTDEYQSTDEKKGF
jgi:hypothetical protein